MSMERKRDELAKVIVCLLVSRKSKCNIAELERDYRENEGRIIPYRDFGFHSTLDFLRSIPNYVTLRRQFGEYLVEPVITDKIKHVNDLVIRQKQAKKSSIARRRQSRHSRYYPMVPEPKPFLLDTVQRKVAQILTENPSGVDRSSIVNCLQNSDAIARPVDDSNIDEYMSSVPHIAVTSGNYVYPSRSLTATIVADQSNAQTTNGPVTKDYNYTVKSQYVRCYAAGEEDFNDEFDDFNDFDDDYLQEPSTGKSHTFNNNNNDQPKELSMNRNDHEPKLTSAESFERAKNLEPLNREFANNTERMNATETHEKNEYNSDEESTFSSENEASTTLINERLQTRLTELIKKHPDGIWCVDLPQTFLDEYKVRLDFAELGYASVCELASSIPKIFRLHRWNDRGDFMLYDATKPLPSSLKKPISDNIYDEAEDVLFEDVDEIDPFSMTMAFQVSKKLIPDDVMTHDESVGQERIPKITSDEVCIEVHVAEVYTPSLFWIHLRRKRVKLYQLMQNMQQFYEQDGDNYTIPHCVLEKGLNCVCVFENQWHRAIIKTVKPDGDVTLIFYDFGTIKTYPPDNIRYLHRTFSNLPAQGIPCGLYNVKPINSDNWTRGASSEFWTKVMNIPLIAIVLKVDHDNNSMLVSLADTQYDEDLHINDWMVQQGLAEYGSMGTSVNLDEKYHEDLDLPPPDPTTKDIPLVRPQHTLVAGQPQSDLKPPPGFTKLTEPGNVAAFMDECANGTSYTATEFWNPSFSNSCKANANINPLESQNVTHNPLIFLSEAMIQSIKAELQKEIDVKIAEVYEKLATANSNDSSILNGTSFNNSNTNLLNNDKNPIPQQTRNPFKEESGTTTNNFDRFNHSPTRLGTNTSNPFSTVIDTTSPNSAKRSNSDCGVSNGSSSFNLKKLLSELTKSVKTESCKKMNSNPEPPIQNLPDTHASNFYNNNNNSDKQFQTDPKNMNNNFTLSVNNEKFPNQQLHCTNPFRECTTQNFTNGVEPRKEQSFKIKVEHHNGNDKPPIPPRNPDLINKSLNLTLRDTTHVKTATLPTVQNHQEESTKTKIYYESKPVMYDLRKTGTSQTSGRPNEEILKSIDTQVQQRTGNLSGKPLKISSIKKEPVSGNLRINSDITNGAKFINQENLKSSSSMDHGKLHNLNNTCSESSEKKGVFQFTFKPVTKAEKSIYTRSHEIFEQEKRQIESSHSPISRNSQIHSKVTSESDVKSENRSSKLLDARPASMATNILLPPHHQPHLSNTTQQYAPSFSFLPTQCGPIYNRNPYYAPPAMPDPGTRQRKPTSGPGVFGCYPSPTNWPGTQFYSPGYEYQYTYAPYPQQYSPLPPHPWNHLYIPQNDKLQSEKKIELNSSTTASQKNKENIDPSRHVKMSSVLPKSTGNNAESLTTSTSTNILSFKNPQELTSSQKDEASSLRNENTLRNVTENTVKESTHAKARNSSETLPIVSPKKNLEESFDQNLNRVSQSTPCKSITKVFKPVVARNQTLYLFNINNEGWFCTDEIIQVFTSYSNRNVVLLILDRLGIEINFKEVSRAQSPILFSELDSTTIRLPRMTNTKKIRGSLHLTPVKSLARLMVNLRVVPESQIDRMRMGQKPPSGSILRELVTLITSFKENDEYWVS